MDESYVQYVILHLTHTFTIDAVRKGRPVSSKLEGVPIVSRHTSRITDLLPVG